MFEQSTTRRGSPETGPLRSERVGSLRAGWWDPLVLVPSAILLAGLLAPARTLAQAYTPPPPPLTTAPCVPTKKDPCPAPPAPPPPTTDKFPFPGDSAPPPAIGSVDDPSVKPAPGAASKSAGGGDPFPFPGESPGAGAAPSGSKAAPDEAGGADKFPFPGLPGLPGDGAGSSSSSSSSSSGSGATDSGEASSDPAKPRLKDEGSAGSTPSSRRKLAKVEDLDEREAKDLEVSHFYLTTGDFLGAYNRAKDAIRIDPDDPEAHFALAAAAQKLKKNDEAVAEYTSYLKLEPDGDHVKVAKRALTEIH